MKYFKLNCFAIFILFFNLPCWGQSQSAYYTGDGGRGSSIAILPPKATGLTAQQDYIPALVQGELVSNFTTFSAIAVLDRQRLEEQYAELLSGYYSDDAKEGLDLGHLSPTDYIMGGSITRTNTGFVMQISITRSADKMTVASYSGSATLDELTNLSGVRRASLDLLGKMGVRPTQRTRTELSGAADANRINAQTAVARGITADHLKNTAEALAQYYQAIAYDPTFAEAAARANTMSTSVRTGSMGANIRNDIAWRDEWVQILADAQRSLQNIPHPQRPSPPQQIVIAQIVAPAPRFIEGPTDYKARTVQLMVDFDINGLFEVLYPAEYRAAYDAYHRAFRSRSDVYNRIVQDLNAGLQATRRNAAWKLTELSPITRDPPAFTPRSGEVTVSARVELLNDTGRVIGNSGNAAELGRFTFGERGTAVNTRANIRQFVFTVSADDITDQMSLRMTASTSPSQGNVAQVMTREEFELSENGRRIMARLERERAEAEARRRREMAEAAARQERERAARAAEAGLEQERAEARRQQEVTRKRQEIFKHSLISPIVFEIGYIFQPDFPIGFRIGTFGFYTTWNFHIPDWWWQDYNNDGMYSYMTFEEAINKLAGSEDLGNRTKESFEWVLGFSINIFDNLLMIPIGIGGRHTLEYGLLNDTRMVAYYRMEDWKSQFLCELGLSFNPIKWVSLIATYRLIGFQESSFTVGSCLTIPKSVWQ